MLIDDTFSITDAGIRVQSIRMSTFQEKKNGIKEDNRTYTLTSTWIFTQGKWGCRKRAEARIRVGLIVGPTVLSYQYPFLVHFHYTLVQFIPRELLFFPFLPISLYYSSRYKPNMSLFILRVNAYRE